MRRLDTAIEISSKPERVWAILMEFGTYPRWNPFVRSIAGRAAVGETLDVFLQPPGSGGMRFRPRVLASEPQREFRWKGKLFVRGLFDGEHYFRLEPLSDARVRFHQGEIFTGLLVPLFARSLDGNIRQGFVAMNEALKREAEAT